MSNYFPTFKKILTKTLGFNFKKFFKIIFIIIIFIAAYIIIKDEVKYQLDIGDDYYESDDLSSDCNVVGVILHGELVTYIADSDDSESNQTTSENIVYTLEDLAKNEDVKAIILEIDSLGGDPVAGEEVANALKRVTKPTVALIRGYGDSAAYCAATGADVIFASKNSDIGCIGATASYLDYSQQNQQEGITYNQLSSGKFKDMFDYDKPLTTEEKTLIMRDINILHENFIKDVAENRQMDIDQVRKLADGSSMLGEMALEKGLIDQIGDEYEVRKYLKEKLGEEIKICW
ncbi:MAG: S49 family peptidase [Patescibacteria group bacterium]|nr:S49 family peptidase [Patescibacteria group bacterium]